MSGFHVFSDTCAHLHVFAVRSDWFVMLFVLFLAVLWTVLRRICMWILALKGLYHTKYQGRVSKFDGGHVTVEL